jgi:hypothetical protein
MTPFESGVLTFWGAVGAMAMRATAPFVLKRFGFRRVIIANGIVAGLLIAAPAFFSATTPYAVVAGILLIGGFFRSLQFTSANSLAFADLDQNQMSQATAITSVAQQLALSTGVATAALALEATRYARGDLTLVAADFGPAFLFVGLVAMCSVVFFLRLPNDAGSALTTPKQVAETAREPDPH